MPLPELPELRKFGFIFAGMIVLIFGLLLPWLFGHGFPLWPWVVAAVIVLIATFLPAQLKWIYRPWMIIGFYLGAFNTKLILSILYFLIITPMGFMFRLLSKNAINRPRNKADGSYWKKSKKQQPENLENTY